MNIYKLRAFNFGFGCLFAGLAGVLAAGVLGLTPPMGNSLLMPSFVAIIIGGVGSLFGAVVEASLSASQLALLRPITPQPAKPSST